MALFFWFHPYSHLCKPVTKSLIVLQNRCLPKLQKIHYGHIEAPVFLCRFWPCLETKNPFLYFPSYERASNGAWSALSMISTRWITRKVSTKYGKLKYGRKMNFQKHWTKLVKDGNVVRTKVLLSSFQKRLHLKTYNSVEYIFPTPFLSPNTV